MITTPTRSRSALGRPPERQMDIVSELRRRIVSGEWQPGTRLPNRTEIEQLFAASPITVQRVLDQLVQDGFVCVRGRLGSYVSEHPPHLNRIGIVFPSQPGYHWGQFSTALFQEAQRAESEGPYQLPVYYGVDGHEDAEDYQRLLRDLAANRVAGLAFMTSPMSLLQTPLFQDPTLKRVAIMELPTSNVAAVTLDRGSFLRKALSDLQQRGRRRVAFVNSPAAFPKFSIPEEVQRFGLETRPYWQLALGLDWLPAARECTQLLFHEGQDVRPDALIVSDDNLLQPASAGLVAAGVRVPEQVEVIAHSNFPYPTTSDVPVRRLGFSVHEIMNACLASIELQFRDPNSAPHIVIEARFEGELPEGEQQEPQNSDETNSLF